MKFLNSRGATAVAILPPQPMELAALLFVWSCAGLNAIHCRVETKFYRRPSTWSNFETFWHFLRWSGLRPATPSHPFCSNEHLMSCMKPPRFNACLPSFLLHAPLYLL